MGCHSAKMCMRPSKFWTPNCGGRLSEASRSWSLLLLPQPALNQVFGPWCECPRLRPKCDYFPRYGMRYAYHDGSNPRRVEEM